MVTFWFQQTPSGVQPPDEAMDRWFVPDTDAATLVLFDPACIDGERKRDREWWTEGEALLAEVGAESLAAVRTGGVGTFRVLLSPSAPPGPALQWSYLQVTSGRLCLAEGEALPWIDGGAPDPDDPESFPVPVGRYRVEVRTPASDSIEAADYVLTLRPVGPHAGTPPISLDVIPPAARPDPPRLDEEALNSAERRLFEVAGCEDVKETLRACDGVLALNPRDSRCLNYRALIREGEGDISGAVRDAARATRARPDYGNGWNSLAYYLLLAGRPSEAFQAARRAVELLGEVPEPSFPWSNLGDAAAALGREAEAISYWESALHHGHPDERGLQRKIGRVRREGSGPRPPLRLSRARRSPAARNPPRRYRTPLPA